MKLNSAIVFCLVAISGIQSLQAQDLPSRQFSFVDSLWPVSTLGIEVSASGDPVGLTNKKWGDVTPVITNLLASANNRIAESYAKMINAKRGSSLYEQVIQPNLLDLQAPELNAIATVKLDKAIEVVSNGFIFATLPIEDSYDDPLMKEKVIRLYSQLGKYAGYFTRATNGLTSFLRYGQGNLSTPISYYHGAFGSLGTATVLAIDRPEHILTENSLSQIKKIFDQLDILPEDMLAKQGASHMENWTNVLIGFKSLRNFVASIIVAKAGSSKFYKQALVEMLAQKGTTSKVLFAQSELSTPISKNDNEKLRAKKMVVRDLFALMSPLDSLNSGESLQSAIKRQRLFELLTLVTENLNPDSKKDAKIDFFSKLQKEGSETRICRRAVQNR